MEGTLTESTAEAQSHFNRSSGGSPWGKTTSVEPCSLEDVMSEQLASELQSEEDQSIHPVSQR